MGEAIIQLKFCEVLYITNIKLLIRKKWINHIYCENISNSYLSDPKNLQEIHTEINN